MEDYLGNELNIGDKVVLITPKYRDFSKGEIIKFTKYYVFVKIDNSPQYSNFKQFPSQLIKIK